MRVTSQEVVTYNIQELTREELRKIIDGLMATDEYDFAHEIDTDYKNTFID